MKKPIRLFWSPLTRRIYATQHWKEGKGGYVIVTGEKWDVTNDVGRIITEEELEFTLVKQKKGHTKGGGDE